MAEKRKPLPMSSYWHNPLDSIFNAVTSEIGWAMMIPCLVYLGLILGCLPRILSLGLMILMRKSIGPRKWASKISA